MTIALDRLRKQFGALRVVDDVSLEVAAGELFVLLGGSGSGKSTVLRLIAGLLTPDAGRVRLRGRDVTALPPQERGIGFVFQNYSIFRHMSVAENVEFGLRVRGVPRARRAERRDELLALVGLVGLGDRTGDQLSGGQRQRVALARALAYEPGVLLLDEPFGALDVLIRVQLRRALRRIQQQIGVTTILVTHDQEEAFEMGDRIGVMEHGRLLEIGTPESLYHRPRTLFVATFLGAGLVLGGRATENPPALGPIPLEPSESRTQDGGWCQLLVRPEQVALSPEPPTDGAPLLGEGEIVEQHFTGPLRHVHLRLPHVEGLRQVAPQQRYGEEGLLVEALLPGDRAPERERWWLSLRGWHELDPPHLRLLLVTASPAARGPHLAGRLVSALPATVDVLFPDPARRVSSSGLREAGLPEVTVADPPEAPIDWILAEQARGRYELVIIDRDDPLLDALLDAASEPVLVATGEIVPGARLLIATGGGEPGKRDVRVGGLLARRLGAPVTLLHVTRPGQTLSWVTRRHLEDGAATLRALDLEVALRHRVADEVSDGIIEAARSEEVGLIVLGAHPPAVGRGDDIDIPRATIARAPCPVMVVPEPRPRVAPGRVDPRAIMGPDHPNLPHRSPP